jgi:hypothetical protein
VTDIHREFFNVKGTTPSGKELNLKELIEQKHLLVCKYTELRKYVYPANAKNLAKNGVFTMEPEILFGIIDGKP